MNNKIVFLIQSQDRKDLSATTTFFSTLGFNILHCQQHTDAREGRYFMRIEAGSLDLPSTRSNLKTVRPFLWRNNGSPGGAISDHRSWLRFRQ